MGRGAERLTTERLTLDPVTEADAPALQGLLNDPEVGRYLLDGERVSRAWVRQVIEDSDEAFRTRGLGLYLARDEQGGLVGLVGFRAFFDPPELQLLYALAPGRGGQGYATEMARRVVRFAFEERALDEVRASTDAPNVRSMHLLERLGMQVIGRGPGTRYEQVHYSLRRSREQR